MIDLRNIIGRKMRGKIMYALSFLPDKPYLRLFYFATTGKMINFKNPKGFNEKLQWLKLNDRHPEYCKQVDNLAVRDHIYEVLGESFFSWQECICHMSLLLNRALKTTNPFVAMESLNYF